MKNLFSAGRKNKPFLIAVFVLVFVMITSTALGLRLEMFVASAKNAQQSINIKANKNSDDSSDFSYTEASGKGLLIIDVSKNKDTLTAPGFVNEYVFNVVNTESFSLKYESTAASEFTNSKNMKIPIEVRMLDHNGNYCIGSEDKWVPAEEMDYFSKNNVLAPHSYEQYTLQWRWPYESGDDENDTNIGVASVEHKITLKVYVEVSAEKAFPNEEPGGIPDTGDSSQLALWLTVASVSFVALFVLLIFGNKEKRNDEEEPKAKA